MKTKEEIHRQTCYDESGRYKGKDSTYEAMQTYADQETEKLREALQSCLYLIDELGVADGTAIVQAKQALNNS